MKRVQIGFDFQEEIFFNHTICKCKYLFTIYVHPVPANIPKKIVPIPTTYCIVYGSLNYFFKHYLPKVSKKTLYTYMI